MMRVKPSRIAILISGRGSNMQSIVKAVELGQIPGEICCVLSNKPKAAGLRFAKQNGIATESLNHKDYISREEFDTALVQSLASYNPDLIVLAGFMRILTPVFIDHFAGRIVNIHPSLLPKYPGLNTHERALHANDKQHGASVHFVTADLDAGPVIIQTVIDIEFEDTPEKLAIKVLAGEHVIYPLAIEWILNGDIQTDKNQCFFQGSAMVKPAKWYNQQLKTPELAL